MDRSILNEMRAVLRRYESYLSDDMNVMDLGSYDVNGTLRSVLPEEWQYIGVDRVEGPNVDKLVSCDYNLPVYEESIDIVVSSSCLQYVRNPFKMMDSIYKCLRPGGMVILCAAATERPGLISLPKGECPNQDPEFDCWRILKDGMEALLHDSGFNVEEVYYRGSNCWGIGFK